MFGDSVSNTNADNCAVGKTRGVPKVFAVHYCTCCTDLFKGVRNVFGDSSSFKMSRHLDEYIWGAVAAGLGGIRCFEKSFKLQERHWDAADKMICDCNIM